MTPFEALAELPKLVEDYKRVATELKECQQELATLKDDQYVTWEWICQYFDISKSTAMLMLADEKLFVHGRQIKRFKKSAIIKFAERNSIKVNQLSQADG
ncbi:helix-turn-helix domain-containing protein [Spirosoma oryzicola]|uniref:helix-turn-helix domain-containing protein n=1 Tax=Spirosoma oryzicola TaxID=2898794 RepID=UPI001E3E5766|nr:helix-turn-helix domain-containing protein [Spirosoma oryzicola]UHG93209.1 helix-turn-helix domain-containing protein [Spirosoma oryzicola]